MKDAFNKELKVGDIVLYGQSTGIRYTLGEIIKITDDKVVTRRRTGYGWDAGSVEKTIPGKVTVKISKTSNGGHNLNKNIVVLSSNLLLLKSNQKETS